MNRPLTMKGAADALGVSYRTMVEVVKGLTPDLHFDVRGKRRVFYTDQIERIRRDGWASKSNGVRELPTPSEPSRVDAYGKALALATQLKQRKPAPHSRRGSGGRVSTAMRP